MPPTTEGEYVNESKALAVQPQQILSPVMDLKLAKARLKEFQAFVAEYLVENEDFGRVPGITKPFLFKAGADKLCELYGLADSFEIVDKVEDYSRNLFDYTIKCTLTRNGSLVATGLGSCNSYEGKYRWRDENRKCPQCGKEAIIKGKAEYGGGWLCFKKKGGCGAKWADGDRVIEGQVTGKVENEDLPTQKNTILKIAKKRSKIDATLSATRSAGIFTQDEQAVGARENATGASSAEERPEPPSDPQERPTEAPSATAGHSEHEPPEEHEDEISCTVYLVRECKTLPKNGKGGGIPYLEVCYYGVGRSETMLCFDKQLFMHLPAEQKEKRYIFKFREPTKKGGKRTIVQVTTADQQDLGITEQDTQPFNEDIPF